MPGESLQPCACTRGAATCSHICAAACSPGDISCPARPSKTPVWARLSTPRRDRYGETPLHYVDTNRSGTAAAAAVRALVQAGADVHARDRMLNTPLHAVAAGSPGVDGAAATAAARALLAAGAERSAANGEGAPPLLLALEREGAAVSPQLLSLLAPPAEEGGAARQGSSAGEVTSVLPRVAQAWRQSLRHAGLPAAAGTRGVPGVLGRQR